MWIHELFPLTTVATKSLWLSEYVSKCVSLQVTKRGLPAAKLFWMLIGSERWALRTIIESLLLPCLRQNMNTMLFVNWPQLPNQPHMRLYVCLSVHICGNVCVCVCSLLAEGQECPSVCGCTWLQRVMDESGTLPSIFLFIYLFKLGVVSKWSIAHWQMPMYMNMCAW